MKKRKTIASLFAIAAVLLLAFQSPLTALAAGNTYVFHYDNDEEEWAYQKDSWDDKAIPKRMYQLSEDLRDGDSIVVEGVGDDLRLTNVHLANVTVTRGSLAYVYTGGVDECYINAGATASIAGVVNNAYVYDDGAVTFNSNVNNLQVIATNGTPIGYVSVAGDVSVAHVVGRDSEGIYYEIFNVDPGRLEIKDGKVETHVNFFDWEGPARTTPIASASTTTKTSASKSSEYDDVPKTGESTTVYWLLGIAVVCLAGRFALRKVS